MPFYATVGPICMLDDLHERKTEDGDARWRRRRQRYALGGCRIATGGRRISPQKKTPEGQQKRLQPRIGGTEFSSKTEDGDARWRRRRQRHAPGGCREATGGEGNLHKKRRPNGRLYFVEIVGVEPTTLCLQSRCSSQLSYTPFLFFSSVCCVGLVHRSVITIR